MSAASSLDHAYDHCLRVARGHYENFPVASLVLPRRLRQPVAVIYAFARGADDLADEGELPAEARLRLLADYEAHLEAAVAGAAGDDPLFTALADVIRRYRLPPGLFHDLLSAFRQDVVKRRYADFGEVMEYCRRSADPVGRLLLHLAGEATPENLRRSDRVCTALQLINFWQDLAQDIDENDRIYLPQEEMSRFGVTEEALRERRNSGEMRALMEFQYARTRKMMEEGAPLGGRLTGRFGFEIRLIIAGGLRVLDLLETNRHDCFARPRLSWRDGVALTLQAIMHRP